MLSDWKIGECAPASLNGTPASPIADAAAFTTERAASLCLASSGSGGILCPVPSVKYLNTFKVAAKRLSFTAASEELCLTASAVGQHVQGWLENLSWDVAPVLSVNAQTLRLTAAGLLLREHVDSALHRPGIGRQPAAYERAALVHQIAWYHHFWQ